jgi:hypothetical protein
MYQTARHHITRATDSERHCHDRGDEFLLVLVTLYQSARRYISGDYASTGKMGSVSRGGTVELRGGGGLGGRV